MRGLVVTCRQVTDKEKVNNWIVTKLNMLTPDIVNRLESLPAFVRTFLSQAKTVSTLHIT